MVTSIRSTDSITWLKVRTTGTVLQVVKYPTAAKSMALTAGLSLNPTLLSVFNFSLFSGQIFGAVTDHQNPVQTPVIAQGQYDSYDIYRTTSLGKSTSEFSAFSHLEDFYNDYNRNKKNEYYFDSYDNENKNDRYF